MFSMLSVLQYMGPSMEEAQMETLPLPQRSPGVSRITLSSSFPVALNPGFLHLNPEKQAEKLSVLNIEKPSKPIRPIPILPVPPSSKMAALNLDKTITTMMGEPLPLSLKLATPTSPQTSSNEQQKAQSPSAAAHSSSSFQASSDSIISVA